MMNTIAKYAVTTLIITQLIGCGTIGEKQEIVEESKAELLPTLQFIPAPKVDSETSQQMPYQAAVNPYLVTKVKIKKRSVEQFIEARRAFNAEDWDTADQLLQQLIESDSSLSGPWVMRGDIALHHDKPQEAIDDFLKALDVNPNNVNAYMRLAKTQRVMGKFILAQNTYAEALTLWPDFPEAHLNLAILYDIYLNLPMRAQKHMEAYQYLAENKNPEVENWLAEIQSRTGAKTTLGEPERNVDDSAALQVMK